MPDNQEPIPVEVKPRMAFDVNIVGKRFVVAIIALLLAGFISCSLLVLAMLNKITFAEVMPIISSAILIIGGVAGGFFGVQTLTDYISGKKGDQKNGR